MSALFLSIFKTPDTWSVSHCGKNILSTVNLRLYRRSLEYSTQGKGFLSTFSSLVIKGQVAHFFHIGDSRIYYLPGAASERASEGMVQDVVQNVVQNIAQETGQDIDLETDQETGLNVNSQKNPTASFRCLTRDHSRTVSDQQTFLTRAIGMDNHLPLDYGQQAIAPGDSFLLTSDGIHDFIDDTELREIMLTAGEPDDICEHLFRKAMDNGSDDNVSVVYACIESLSDSISIEDEGDNNRKLPFPPDDLKSGMILDGYKIEKELFSSSRSQPLLGNRYPKWRCFRDENTIKKL